MGNRETPALRWQDGHEAGQRGRLIAVDQAGFFLQAFEVALVGGFPGLAFRFQVSRASVANPLSIGGFSSAPLGAEIPFVRLAHVGFPFLHKDHGGRDRLFHTVSFRRKMDILGKSNLE